MEEIQKDVCRTYPEMHFFADTDGGHQLVLRRILFVYAKINGGVRYVQVRAGGAPHPLGY